MARAAKKTPGSAAEEAALAEEQRVRFYPLADLRLDAGNPRLGAQAGRPASQVEVLDIIVNKFGIDDVLSSIAVNGYFPEEPLVGVPDEEGRKEVIRIAEGNRRLAACLVLAGDQRARNHEKRTREYQALRVKRKTPPVTDVPVIVHEHSGELLSYMGVRHIAASQGWDSYAKAAWVAEIIETEGLDLEDVSEMIGDQHRTVARILEGYYFVQQLVEAGLFNPADSQRRGRGSNPDYPFSWIYTALGHRAIRTWLGLGDLSEASKKKPLKKPKLRDAIALLTFLFGNDSQSRHPAISDSRQISKLAAAVGDPETRRMLAHGKTVEQVEDLLRPVKERISDGLLDAQDALQRVLTPLSQGEVDPSVAGDLIAPSKKVRSLASDVHKRIVNTAVGEEDDVDA